MNCTVSTPFVECTDVLQVVLSYCNAGRELRAFQLVSMRWCEAFTLSEPTVATFYNVVQHKLMCTRLVPGRSPRRLGSREQLRKVQLTSELLELQSEISVKLKSLAASVALQAAPHAAAVGLLIQQSEERLQPLRLAVGRICQLELASLEALPLQFPKWRAASVARATRVIADCVTRRQPDDGNVVGDEQLSTLRRIAICPVEQLEGWTALVGMVAVVRPTSIPLAVVEVLGELFDGDDDDSSAAQPPRRPLRVVKALVDLITELVASAKAIHLSEESQSLSSIRVPLTRLTRVQEDLNAAVAELLKSRAAASPSTNLLFCRDEAVASTVAASTVAPPLFTPPRVPSPRKVRLTVGGSL